MILSCLCVFCSPHKILRGYMVVGDMPHDKNIPFLPIEAVPLMSHFEVEFAMTLFLLFCAKVCFFLLTFAAGYKYLKYTKKMEAMTGVTYEKDTQGRARYVRIDIQNSTRDEVQNDWSAPLPTRPRS